MSDAAVARAEVLIDLGRAGEARATLGRHLATAPADVQALCVMARACLDLDDLDAAFAAARAAILQAPDREWPHRLAAIALMRQDRIPEALHAADTAVRLAPFQWQTYQVRAQVDIRGRRVSETTLRWANQAVALAPQEASAHAVLGAVHLELNRTADAERALRSALRLDPQHYSARNDLARIDLRRHRLGRAVRGFADAAALSVRDDAAASNVAVVLARTLRRLLVVMIVLWVAVGIAATAHGQGARITRFALWGLAPLALAWGVFSVRVGGAGRTWRVLGASVRARSDLLVWVGVVLIAFGVLTITAFASSGPGGVHVPSPLPAVAIGLVAVRVLRRRRRR